MIGVRRRQMQCTLVPTERLVGIRHVHTADGLVDENAPVAARGGATLRRRTGRGSMVVAVRRVDRSTTAGANWYNAHRRISIKRPAGDGLAPTLMPPAVAEGEEPQSRRSVWEECEEGKRPT